MTTPGPATAFARPSAICERHALAVHMNAMRSGGSEPEDVGLVRSVISNFSDFAVARIRRGDKSGEIIANPKVRR